MDQFVQEWEADVQSQESCTIYRILWSEKDHLTVSHGVCVSVCVCVCLSVCEQLFPEVAADISTKFYTLTD